MVRHHVGGGRHVAGLQGGQQVQVVAQPSVGVRGLDDDEGYSTVAGLVMHLLRTVPKEGDKAVREPLHFEVIDMDGRRIDKVLVRKVEPMDMDPSG